MSTPADFDPAEALAKINTKIPHPARVWDYWLGGKDHFAADREAGEHLLAAMPSWVEVARADREFLARAVRHLVEEAGIRQFLDIGTGIPTANNTHEVAQSIAPESRIVYVDNDPIVLVHARALLTSTPEGATAYIDADLREPEGILERAKLTLDFDRPIAITLLAIMEFIIDDGEAQAILKRLMDAVPSGSYLAIAQPVHSEAIDEAAQRWNDSGGTTVSGRHPEQIAAFFAGLDLVEPGVVALPRWRPDAATSYTDRDIPSFCGVARKP